jgi:hypothetical protein
MKLKDALYYILIFVVIVTCIFVVYYLMSNSNQCLADPITYYQAKTGAECFCYNSIVTP